LDDGWVILVSTVRYVYAFLNRHHWSGAAQLVSRHAVSGVSAVYALRRSIREAEQVIDESGRRLAESFEAIRRFDNVKRREQ